MGEAKARAGRALPAVNENERAACLCSQGSPDPGKEQKGGELPWVMNLDLRA